jgi:LuxR family maltose regulon positive regulatory protein
LTRDLTFICAPAGFGKTVLVSEWLSRLERSASWLSLDQGDDDLVGFLTYVLAALQRIDAGLGQTTQALLQASPLPTVEALLTPLINEITALDTPFVLVLDDYHVITFPKVHEAMTFVLENMPPQVHLVIATRQDPRLPLGRLRAQGQMTEIRAGDLRFTQEEASAFLNQAMGLNLSLTEVVALEQRTEGWIAGDSQDLWRAGDGIPTAPRSGRCSFLRGARGWMQDAASAFRPCRWQRQWDLPGISPALICPLNPWLTQRT